MYSGDICPTIVNSQLDISCCLHLHLTIGGQSFRVRHIPRDVYNVAVSITSIFQPAEIWINTNGHQLKTVFGKILIMIFSLQKGFRHCWMRENLDLIWKVDSSLFSIDQTLYSLLFNWDFICCGVIPFFLRGRQRTVIPPIPRTRLRILVLKIHELQPICIPCVSLV